MEDRLAGPPVLLLFRPECGGTLVLNGITIRGSIVGTRNNLQESIDFAADGQVTAHVESVEPLENINDIFDRMRAGAITGRVVLDLTNGAV